MSFYLYALHNKSSVHLTPTTEVQRSGQVTDSMRSGWRTPRDFICSSPTSVPTFLEWPCQEQRGSGSTASIPVLDVSAPAYTNGVWLPLRLVSVGQKNRLLTILSFIVQSINLPMEHMAWRFLMKQSNGCSTSAPRPVAALQWVEKTCSNDKEVTMFNQQWPFLGFSCGFHFYYSIKEILLQQNTATKQIN